MPVSNPDSGSRSRRRDSWKRCKRPYGEPIERPLRTMKSIQLCGVFGMFGYEENVGPPRVRPLAKQLAGRDDITLGADRIRIEDNVTALQQPNSEIEIFVSELPVSGEDFVESSERFE
jgi:hypothetical protein